MTCAPPAISWAGPGGASRRVRFISPSWIRASAPNAPACWSPPRGTTSWRRTMGSSPGSRTAPTRSVDRPASPGGSSPTFHGRDSSRPRPRRWRKVLSGRPRIPPGPGAGRPRTAAAALRGQERRGRRDLRRSLRQPGHQPHSGRGAVIRGPDGGGLGGRPPGGRPSGRCNPGAPLAYLGSGGQVEIAVRDGSAARRFGIGVGGKVRARLG